MPSFWYNVIPFVILVLLIVGEFLCTNATSSQTNVWISRQNTTSSNSNTIWQGPPTTPWPALGARPYNQRKSSNVATINQKPNAGSSQNVNANRNAGIALSYGSDTGQNNLAQKVSNANRGVTSTQNGVALSYGVNFNRDIQPPKQDKTIPSSSQNSYAAKTFQNSGAATAKPSAGTGNSQAATANTYNTQKPNNAAGSKLQPEKTTDVIDEDEELRQFSETLLRKDVNNVGKYVTINYQGKTTSRSKSDEAPLPLLTIQKDAYNVPTISNLLQLHNNYILETNVNEHVSAQEKMEENSLLDTVLSTPVMQYTRNFLIQKGAISRDPKAFRDKLKEIWFNMYSRGQGKIGSSGFEHVFLAEIKNQDVSGLHNWLYFHDAEAKKNANYLGFLKKIEMNNNKGAILKYHFTLNGIDKPVGSMFIGTSPELEIALYTTCFMLKADEVCPLSFDGKRFIIRTYTYRYRGKNMIGSAFPEI